MARWDFPESLEVLGPDKRAMIQSLDGDVVRRMRNWVAWKGGGSDSCSSSWVLDYGFLRLGGAYREARVPTFVAEAQITQAAIETVANELGSAVALFWLSGLDSSWVELGAQLGCTDKTVKVRVCKGHVEVTAEIYRRLPHALIDAPKPMAPAAAPRERPRSGPVRILTPRDSEV